MVHGERIMKKIFVIVGISSAMIGFLFACGQKGKESLHMGRNSTKEVLLESDNTNNLLYYTADTAPFLRSSHSVGKHFASSYSLLGLAYSLPTPCHILAKYLPGVCEGALMALSASLFYDKNC